MFQVLCKASNSFVFALDAGDEQFEADKAEVIREIASLEIRDQSCAESEDSEIEP